MAVGPKHAPNLAPRTGWIGDMLEYAIDTNSVKAPIRGRQLMDVAQTELDARSIGKSPASLPPACADPGQHR